MKNKAVSYQHISHLKKRERLAKAHKEQKTTDYGIENMCLDCTIGAIVRGKCTYMLCPSHKGGQNNEKD